jgi:hypothetical protein
MFRRGSPAEGASGYRVTGDGRRGTAGRRGIMTTSIVLTSNVNRQPSPRQTSPRQPSSPQTSQRPPRNHSRPLLGSNDESHTDLRTFSCLHFSARQSAAHWFFSLPF